MPSKINRLVMLLGLAGFIVMADNWVVAPLLPAISESIGISAVSAGIFVTAYMLPFGVFQLLFGPLADRYGKTRVILITFTTFTVATTLCALGADLTSIALLRALTGLFAAATMPVSFALIADIVPMKDRQHAIGSFMGVSTFGQALSMGIGGGIAYFFDWRGVFIVYGILSAMIAVALWRGLRMTVGDTEIKNPKAPLLKPYLSLLSNAPSRRTYIVIFVEGIFLLGSFSYFGAYLDHRFHLSFFSIGAVMTAFGIAALIAGRTSAKIATKLGRTTTAVLGLILMAIANELIWVSGSLLALATLAVFMLGFRFHDGAFHSYHTGHRIQFQRARCGHVVSSLLFHAGRSNRHPDRRSGHQRGIVFDDVRFVRHRFADTRADLRESDYGRDYRSQGSVRRALPNTMRHTSNPMQT